jgi:predicted amino acid racemase
MTVPMLLVRSPMLSQVERVVAHAAISCNSDMGVLEALAAAAAQQGRRHGVLLMVELGDLREGILPVELEQVAQRTLALPNLRLVGIGWISTTRRVSAARGWRPAPTKTPQGRRRIETKRRTPRPPWP